jgi:catechol 2,3-dioxygenase-like lactoylglutathione lyase family enzyme
MNNIMVHDRNNYRGICSTILQGVRLKNSNRWKSVSSKIIGAGLVGLAFTIVSAQPSAVPTLLARFEHVALNVPDPVAMAKWYTDNLGMKVVRSGPDPIFTTFLADSGMHMMMELFHNAEYPLLEPAKIHPMAIHFAFVTPDIGKTQSQLLASGAVVVDSLRKTASGDQVLSLRDPWGWTIQFVQRVKPMLGFHGLYPEHFAINVADARAKAQWYKDHLGMVIIRQGGAPTFGTFIADSGKNMMYELYQNSDYSVVDFAALSHMSLHVAFMVEDVQATKELLMAAGAKVVEDITKTPSGDSILMLRDPWNLPIQFVKRTKPMLK